MAKIGSIRYHSLENVTEHEAVNLTVLDLRVFAGPGNIEDVGDVSEFRKLGLGLGSISNVALNVLHWVILVPVGPGTASHAVDFPWATRCVGEWEDLRQTVADNPGNSYNQGYALAASSCFIFFLQIE
jgi:hypothetical protein